VRRFGHDVLVGSPLLAELLLPSSAYRVSCRVRAGRSPTGRSRRSVPPLNAPIHPKTRMGPRFALIASPAGMTRAVPAMNSVRFGGDLPVSVRMTNHQPEGLGKVTMRHGCHATRPPILLCKCAGIAQPNRTMRDAWCISAGSSHGNFTSLGDPPFRVRRPVKGHQT
jgi:hypothetical protein